MYRCIQAGAFHWPRSCVMPRGMFLCSGLTSISSCLQVDVLIWDLEQAKKNADKGEPSAGGVLLDRLRQHLGKVSHSQINLLLPEFPAAMYKLTF